MALRFMNDTRKPRHVISGKLGYHQNIHYKLGKGSGSINLGNIDKLMKELKKYLDAFAFGDQETLKDLNLDEYLRLGSSILNKSSASNPQLKGIYSFFYSTVQGVFSSKTNQANCENLEREVEELREKASILDDPDKLTDYINNLAKRASFRIFPEKEIVTVKAQIKPIYRIYFERHGIPDAEHPFDLEKLATIERELANS